MHRKNEPDLALATLAELRELDSRYPDEGLVARGLAHASLRQMGCELRDGNRELAQRLLDEIRRLFQRHSEQEGMSEFLALALFEVARRAMRAEASPGENTARSELFALAVARPEDRAVRSCVSMVVMSAGDCEDREGVVQALREYRALLNRLSLQNRKAYHGMDGYVVERWSITDDELA